jgi:GxxExxY protein
MSFSPQRAQRTTEGSGINQITEAIIGAAIKVHSALGPGLLEKAYEVCLAHELAKAGFNVRTQVELPVIYDGVRVELGYRIDLLVNDLVSVELKCVDQMIPIYDAQIISYLKLSGKRVGLLINFHVRYLKDGIRRFIEGVDPRKSL